MAKYYDVMEESFLPIPEAPYYVVSEDTFMSGWGHAKDKRNIVVVPCDDYDTAERVFDYAKSRSDQKKVRINTTPPETKQNVIYSLVSDWIETSLRWDEGGRR